MDDLHKHDPKYKKLDSGDHIVIIYLDATPFLLNGHDTAENLLMAAWSQSVWEEGDGGAWC